MTYLSHVNLLIDKSHLIQLPKNRSLKYITCMTVLTNKIELHEKIILEVFFLQIMLFINV